MRKTNVPFTDTKYYECEYCHEDFVPNRRHIQKYCSNSCRSKAHRRKAKKKEILGPKLNGIQTNEEEKPKNKIEAMSLSGVGNSAAGTVLVQAANYLLTPEHNRNATKGDIQQILNSQKRYIPINNRKLDPDGRAPYFDTYTRNICYFNEWDVRVS